jgi:hypothetical protein
MNLSEIYSKTANNNKINSLAGLGVSINRDPTINQLEKNVFEKLKELSGPEIRNISPKNTVQIVSFEQALKELVNLH